MSGCTVLEFGQAGRELVALLHEANERHRELPDEPHPRIDYALTGLAAVVDWIVVLDRSPTTRRLGPAHLLAAELVIPSLAEPIHALPVFPASDHLSSVQHAAQADHEEAQAQQEVSGEYNRATGAFSMHGDLHRFEVRLSTHSTSAVVLGPPAPVFVRTQRNGHLTQSGSAILFDTIHMMLRLPHEHPSRTAGQAADSVGLHVLALVLLERLCAEHDAATLQLDHPSWRRFLRTVDWEAYRQVQTWVSAGHLEDEGRVAQQVGEWLSRHLSREATARGQALLVSNVAATLGWVAGFFVGRAAPPSIEMRSLGNDAHSPYVPQRRRLDSQY
ncbi:hypothetical protein JCM8208_002802 [Rhodotorula glutinis]